MNEKQKNKTMFGKIKKVNHPEINAFNYSRDKEDKKKTK